MVLGYLGLGSNEGDRLWALRAARDALDREPGITVSAQSSVYETAPQGEVPDQADFLNAVVAIETDLGAEELLRVCKRVERRLGRRPGGERHGPRPIDVDLLTLGDIERAGEPPVLPHPEVTARRFVLEPLLELDPALALPGGVKLGPLLDGVRDQPVTRVGRM